MRAPPRHLLVAFFVSMPPVGEPEPWMVAATAGAAGGAKKELRVADKTRALRLCGTTCAIDLYFTHYRNSLCARALCDSHAVSPPKRSPQHFRAGDGVQMRHNCSFSWVRWAGGMPALARRGLQPAHHFGCPPGSPHVPPFGSRRRQEAQTGSRYWPNFTRRKPFCVTARASWGMLLTPHSARGYGAGK